jgi:hypothetical protein
MKEEGYKHVINSTKRWIDYSYPVSVIVDEMLSSGRGWFYDKKIELPTWINRYHVSFRIYYVVHELVHCIVGVKHDDTFKRVEDKLLALWDIRIVRKTVYPREFYYHGKKIRNVPKSTP